MVRRDIIEVDMEAEDKFVELRQALSLPEAKIVSTVSSGTKVVYVVESKEQ